ncbi:hypothetical protein Taro_004390 [Colocasia esculenta]|uniref:Aminotransferase-like plant mobile domain-containing protein n=1 Tax=Colocasia esculenta TaxID=4460 RepID=A0A843TRI7_COLES|nr:hypothetical protein [Colocasia esculenta]
MEGGGDGEDGGDRRKRGSKRSIRRRQTDEGPSTAARRLLRQLPWRMTLWRRRVRTNQSAPKRRVQGTHVGLLPKVERPGNGYIPSLVTLRTRQHGCRITRGKATLDMSPSEDDASSELWSWLGWAIVRAIYQGLLDFQRTRLEEMGFGPFLRLDELMLDVALIQALKERWDPECHAFLFPWGHMIPTLEDVAQITGLRVDGQAVTGVTYPSYQELAEWLLGLEVTRERSSLVQRMRLQASLGVADTRHQTREGQVDYMARLTEDARAALAEEEGEAADRDLRRFLILVIGKLILGTRGDPVCCRCLPLQEDLSSVGSYAWGAALLAHLFDSLGTSSRETGVGILSPPLLGSWCTEATRRCAPSTALAVLSRRVVTGLQVTLIHNALDTVPFGHWTPYVGEDDTAQPWVERGRPYFGRDIWLHAFNTVVPLHHRLVARTLGLHQAVVEFPTRHRPWERPGRSFRGIQQETDWAVRVREQLTDWEQRGREVASEATSDEDYFRAYAQRYGAQVYKGSRRPFNPEGQIASLEGVLHSTIQQRDDLQAIMTQLREELDRAQQMVGGASSSREDPGRSVLEGQLAAAVARAEDALAQEAELRDSLARMNMLEAEMAELRLCPEAAEVSRWRQEAEEATRWRTEAGDLHTQLGEERHHCELLRSEMKGLERALALVRRSRSSASRSGILSGSARYYLTGSSGWRRNEEEARRRERAPEGSETGPRVMAPPSPRPPEGTGESG